jgi:flagellin-specific chaperone FliS
MLENLMENIFDVALVCNQNLDSVYNLCYDDLVGLSNRKAELNKIQRGEVVIKPLKQYQKDMFKQAREEHPEWWQPKEEKQNG